MRPMRMSFDACANACHAHSVIECFLDRMFDARVMSRATPYSNFFFCFRYSTIFSLGNIDGMFKGMKGKWFIVGIPQRCISVNSIDRNLNLQLVRNIFSSLNQIPQRCISVNSIDRNLNLQMVRNIFSRLNQLPRLKQNPSFCSLSFSHTQNE